MTHREVEFVIGRIRPGDGAIAIAGLVNAGSIRIGSTFTEVAMRPPGADPGPQGMIPIRAVHFTVIKIIAYGREIDELPRGMTGEVYVIGTGAEFIATEMSLTSPSEA